MFEHQQCDHVFQLHVYFTKGFIIVDSRAGDVMDSHWHKTNGRTPSSKSWVKMNFHVFPSPLFTHLFVLDNISSILLMFEEFEKKNPIKPKPSARHPLVFCFPVIKSGASFESPWNSEFLDLLIIQTIQTIRKQKKQTINPTSNHQFQNLLLRNRNLQNHQIRLLLPTMVQHLGYIVPSLLPVMHHFLPYPAAQQIESRNILRSWSTIPRTFGDHPKSWHHHRKQTHHHLPRSPGGWWLNHPSGKNISQKWESSPNRDENKKYLKPPPTSAGLKSHHAEESHITQWNCEMEESHITRREVTSFCDNPNGTAAFNRKPKSNQI